MIVVSHRFWSSRLGGDPGAIGRSVRINDKPARIVGVAPPGFFGLIPGEWIDVYRPLAGDAPARSRGSGRDSGRWTWWPALRLGVSGSTAAAAMTPLFRNLVAETIGTKIEEELELIARPAARGLYTGNDAEVSRALWILMLLVGVLLLIVCANVANLLLSRSVKRRPESAVRLALGAGRGAWCASILSKAVCSPSSVALAGLFLGSILARWIHALFQTGQGPGEAFAVTLDWRVPAYALAISTLTALIFGLAPAWTAARSQVERRAQDPIPFCSRRRTPPAEVPRVGPVRAVVRGSRRCRFARAVSWKPVLDRSRLRRRTGLVRDVHAGQAGYSPASLVSYQERLNREITAIPGVLRFAPMFTRPLDGGLGSQSITAPGGPPTHLAEGIVNPAASAHLSAGGPGFIEVLGLRLLTGRTLEAGEGCFLRAGNSPAAHPSRSRALSGGGRPAFCGSLLSGSEPHRADFRCERSASPDRGAGGQRPPG